MESHQQNVNNSYKNCVDFIKENYTKKYDDISSYKLLVVRFTYIFLIV